MIEPQPDLLVAQVRDGGGLGGQQHQRVLGVAHDDAVLRVDGLGQIGGAALGAQRDRNP